MVSIAGMVLAFLDGWVGWLAVSLVVVGIAVGLALYFRSLRRWKQPPPTTPDQIQAEMHLESESHITDRY